MALATNTRIQLMVDTIEKKEAKISITFAIMEFMPWLSTVSKERRMYLKDVHDVISLPRSGQVPVSQTDIAQVFQLLREMGDTKRVAEISTFLCDFVQSKRSAKESIAKCASEKFPVLETSLSAWSTCDNLDGLWNAAYLLQINWLNWLVAILKHERRLINGTTNHQLEQKADSIPITSL